MTGNNISVDDFPVLQRENLPDSVKDSVELEGDGNTSNKRERKKSKKKQKYGSSFAQQSISAQSYVEHDSNDNEVEHADKGKKNNDISVENAPVERKKSKKKHKDDSSSAQLGNSMQSSVDNENNACFDNDVKHDNVGKKKKVKSVENAPIEKKKSKKKRKDDSSVAQLDNTVPSSVDNERNACIDSEVEHGDKGKKKKAKLMENAPIEKKKSKKKHKDDSSVAHQDTPMQSSVDNESDACFESEVEHADIGKKEEAKLMENVPIERKKSKKKHTNDSSLDEQDTSVDDERNAHFDNGVEDANKGNKRKATSPDTDSIERKRSKKKHESTTMQTPVVDDNNACSHANKEKKKKKKAKVVEIAPTDATPNKSKKKVRFSGKDDVFTLPADSNTGSGEEDNLVRGKRFTKEEDEILKQAVYHYIEKHNLGEEEGLDMVLNSKKHKEFRGCWREIGAEIPYRPYTSCYYRAQVIFRRSKTRKWTQEEYEMVLKYQEEHGNQWKDLAEELGKHRWHVKDTWRRIQTRNAKKGHWSQQEYQKLFDLVNTDLQSKVLEEKHSKHGMLRDNISWTAISDQVSSRTQTSCCLKWYDQLTSRMVAEGVWADVDDYALIGALYSLDANCMEDVDWDNILEHRSGDLCRKRWNQMVLHIGHHGNKSFSEQVEVLAQRYCPHLLEAREAWDNKPRVP